MPGRYKDIPPNIQKRLEALFGLTFTEWQQLRHIIDKSFDVKREDAEKSFKLESEKDINNTLFYKI